MSILISAEAISRVSIDDGGFRLPRYFWWLAPAGESESPLLPDAVVHFQPPSHLRGVGAARWPPPPVTRSGRRLPGPSREVFWCPCNRHGAAGKRSRSEGHPVRRAVPKDTIITHFETSRAALTRPPGRGRQLCCKRIQVERDNEHNSLSSPLKPQWEEEEEEGVLLKIKK